MRKVYYTSDEEVIQEIKLDIRMAGNRMSAAHSVLEDCSEPHRNRLGAFYECASYFGFLKRIHKSYLNEEILYLLDASECSLRDFSEKLFSECFLMEDDRNLLSAEDEFTRYGLSGCGLTLWDLSELSSWYLSEHVFWFDLPEGLYHWLASMKKKRSFLYGEFNSALSIACQRKFLSEGLFKLAQSILLVADHSFVDLDLDLYLTLGKFEQIYNSFPEEERTVFYRYEEG